MALQRIETEIKIVHFLRDLDRFFFDTQKLDKGSCFFKYAKWKNRKFLDCTTYWLNPDEVQESSVSQWRWDIIATVWVGEHTNFGDCWKRVRASLDYFFFRVLCQSKNSKIPIWQFFGGANFFFRLGNPITSAVIPHDMDQSESLDFQPIRRVFLKDVLPHVSCVPVLTVGITAPESINSTNLIWTTLVKL